jgi:hypothetical protein
VNRKFKHLEYSTLLDQLAQYTSVFTKLLNENGTSQEKDEYRQVIQRLLAEINFREREGETRDPSKSAIG